MYEQLRFWHGFKLSEASSEDVAAKSGFEIYRANKVKRLGPNQFLVKTDVGVGSYFVERVDGGGNCDCSPNLSYCAHRHAARLCAAGSVDVSRCGFRYNSYGIARRYKCNECMRKFSLKYTDGAFASRLPTEGTARCRDRNGIEQT